MSLQPIENNILGPNTNNLAQLSASQAQHNGHETAFYFLGESYTFAAVQQHAKQIASWLTDKGIQKNDRVVLVSKDCIDGYALLFATAQIGAILVPVNWRLTAPEVNYIIDDSEASLVIIQTDLADTTAQQFALSPIYFEHGELLQIACQYPPFAIEPTHGKDHGAVMLYTSGTTGKPKGVLLAHRTFFTLPQNMSDIGDAWMNIQADDVLLLTLPMFHIGGLWWAIQGFRHAATGVVEPMFVPWRALELIENHQVSLAALVPAMLSACLNEPDCDDTDLTSIRGVLYGGSPISAALLEQAMQHFTAEYFQIYGLTETGNMAVCLRPADHLPASHRDDIPALDRVGIAGKPLPSVNVEVRKPNAQGEFSRCNTHEIGEIFIHSPSVMLHYWNKPEATEETLLNGWIRTGDAGYFDEDGYLLVCDRIKDMIIRAGENLYPAEIESAISGHPAIQEIAVIGIPHEQWGEAVLAILVLNELASNNAPSLLDIHAFIADKLAAHKHPTQLEVVAALPRNPSGKILKHQLRAPYWKDRSRQVN